MSWRRCNVMVETWQPFQCHHAAANTWRPRRCHFVAVATPLNHVTVVAAPLWRRHLWPLLRYHAANNTWQPHRRRHAAESRYWRRYSVFAGSCWLLLRHHAAVTTVPSPRCFPLAACRRCSSLLVDTSVLIQRKGAASSFFDKVNCRSIEMSVGILNYANLRVDIIKKNRQLLWIFFVFFKYFDFFIKVFVRGPFFFKMSFRN